MEIKEFIDKYGTRGFALPIQEFIQRSPKFNGDKELATMVGKIVGDWQIVLETTQGA